LRLNLLFHGKVEGVESETEEVEYPPAQIISFPHLLEFVIQRLEPKGVALAVVSDAQHILTVAENRFSHSDLEAADAYTAEKFIEAAGAARFLDVVGKKLAMPEKANIRQDAGDELDDVVTPEFGGVGCSSGGKNRL